MKKPILKADKKPKRVLSKKTGWSILILLVLLDAFLDVVFAQGKGLESDIWRPVSNILGISSPLLMAPLVILLIYFVVKIVSWLVRKIDKIQNKTEELVLTIFVIIYGVFDLWLILVYFFNFTLFKKHYYLIPILILIGIAYEYWAEKELKKK